MAEYAVVWKAPGELPVAGRLRLGSLGITLEGGERGAVQRIELFYTEIVGLSRGSDRVGRLPALRLEEHAIGSVLIAAINGVALNSEILDQLKTALANVF